MEKDKITRRVMTAAPVIPVVTVQDVGKAVILLALILGTLLETLGNQTLTHIFTAY